MNGRVYDPVLGRFLSPDPVTQDPNNTQNYNKYSYVLNNPLKFTDPSGYMFDGWSSYQISSWLYISARSWGRYYAETGIDGAMANDCIGNILLFKLTGGGSGGTVTSGGGGGGTGSSTGSGGAPSGGSSSGPSGGGGDYTYISGDSDEGGDEFSDGKPSYTYSKASWARLSPKDRVAFNNNAGYFFKNGFGWLSDEEANDVFSTGESIWGIFGMNVASAVYSYYASSYALGMGSLMFTMVMEMQSWGNSQILSNYNAQPIAQRNGVFVKTYGVETKHGGYQYFTYVYDGVSGNLLGVWNGFF